jgi:hypothetical protein
VTLPYSTGSDQMFRGWGPIGSVWTSNGPGLNPSWQNGLGVIEPSVTGNYQIQPTDGIVQFKGPNGQTATLPTAAAMAAAGVVAPKQFVLIANGDGIPVTILAPAGSNINRVSSFVLTTRFSSIIVEWDGKNFFIIAAYLPAAETILVSEWYYQYEDLWISRRFAEAVYINGFFFDFGIEDPVVGAFIADFEKFTPKARFGEAVYAPFLSLDLGIADTVAQTLYLSPAMMGIYDAITRRPYPQAVYTASGPAPMANLAVL